MKDKLFKIGRTRKHEFSKKAFLLSFAFLASFSAVFVPTYIASEKANVETVKATEKEEVENLDIETLED